MSASTSPLASWEKWLLSAVIFGVAAYLALPSLLEAWLHDPYSHGAAIAFGIWLLLIVSLAPPLRSTLATPTLFWLLCAVVLCAVGSMSSLRVLYHAALLLALLDLSRINFRMGMLATLCTLSWLPSSGWLISRFHAGGLVGWERPLAAGLACSLLIFAKRRISFHSP
jgi:hypothetical protein